MPRISQLPLTQRRQIDPRDTFDYTTPNLNAPARPTDPYIQPLSSEAQNLLNWANTMKIVNKGISDYADIQQANIDENKKKAQADAAKDLTDDNSPDAQKEKPHSFLNAGWGYEQAYLSTYGEAQGVKFRNDYAQQLKNNNYYKDSKDPDGDKQNLWDNLYGQYFGDTNDQYVLYGASVNLENAKLEGDQAVNQGKYVKAKETSVNSTQTILNDTAKQYVQGDTDNPIGYQQMADNHYQTDIQPTNLISKDEYTGQNIDALGSAALDAINGKDISADGKTKYRYTTTDAAKRAMKGIDAMKSNGLYDVMDANGNYKYRKQIDAYQESIVKAVDLREKEDDANLQATSAANVVTMVKEISQGKDITKEADALYTKGMLTEDHYLKIIDINRIGNNQEYNIREDGDHILNLEMDVRMGRKGINDILAEHRNKLIHIDTADSLIGLALERQKTLQTKTRADKQLIDEQKSFLYRYFTPTQLQQYGNQKRARAIREYDLRIIKGENPLQVADDIVQRYKTSTDEYPSTRYATEEEAKKAYKAKQLAYQNKKISLPEFQQAKAEFNQDMEIFAAHRKLAAQQKKVNK